MSLVSFTPVADNTTATASGVNTPLSTIYNDYNGNITDANIASNAAIAGSKLGGGITGDKLATTAITIGRGTNTTTAVLTAGNADSQIVVITVTVPSGGRDIELIGYIPNLSDGGAAIGTFKIWKGSIGGTLLNQCTEKWQGSDQHNVNVVAYDPAVGAGSVTYYLTGAAVSANLQYNVGATFPALLSVKLV